jgi:hypothetical protein
MTEKPKPRSAEPSVIVWATDLVGRVLASAFAAVRMVRRPRPIHPNGAVYIGRVSWVNPGGRNSGIAWIDTPPASGGQVVIARVSRSVGLPSALPDVVGLAFKVTTERGAADIELASSWLGVPGRFLLRPTRSLRGAFGSLMPYRSAVGPVLVSARSNHRDGEVWTIDLFYATPLSTWRRFAVVSLDTEPVPDSPTLRFDPIVNPLPGANTYDWTRRLRLRSYRVARRGAAVPAYTATEHSPPGTAP